MNGPDASRPGIGLPVLDRLLLERVAEWESGQAVAIVGMSGQNTTGGTVSIRTRASRATNWIQLHVQTDAGGEGGASYDASNYLSSALVDCREARQQDHSIARNGVKHYYVFFVPVFLQGDGSTMTKFDGVDGPDQMAFWDLGV